MALFRITFSTSPNICFCRPPGVSRWSGNSILWRRSFFFYYAIMREKLLRPVSLLLDMLPIREAGLAALGCQVFCPVPFSILQRGSQHVLLFIKFRQLLSF